MAADIERAKDRGLDAVADAGEAHKLQEIQETYDRPLAPGQSPRTGAWKAGQEIVKGENERSLITVGAAAQPITGYDSGYEGRLAELPVSRDGVNRRNAAAEKTAQWLEQNAQAIFEREIQDVIR